MERLYAGADLDQVRYAWKVILQPSLKLSRQPLPLNRDLTSGGQAAIFPLIALALCSPALRTFRFISATIRSEGETWLTPIFNLHRKLNLIRAAKELLEKTGGNPDDLDYPYDDSASPLVLLSFLLKKAANAEVDAWITPGVKSGSPTSRALMQVGWSPISQCFCWRYGLHGKTLRPFSVILRPPPSTSLLGDNNMQYPVVGLVAASCPLPVICFLDISRPSIPFATYLLVGIFPDHDGGTRHPEFWRMLSDSSCESAKAGLPACKWLHHKSGLEPEAHARFPKPNLSCHRFLLVFQRAAARPPSGWIKNFLPDFPMPCTAISRPPSSLRPDHGRALPWDFQSLLKDSNVTLDHRHAVLPPALLGKGIAPQSPETTIPCQEPSIGAALLAGAAAACSCPFPSLDAFFFNLPPGAKKFPIAGPCILMVAKGSVSISAPGPPIHHSIHFGTMAMPPLMTSPSEPEPSNPSEKLENGLFLCLPGETEPCTITPSSLARGVMLI